MVGVGGGCCIRRTHRMDRHSLSFISWYSDFEYRMRYALRGDQVTMKVPSISGASYATTLLSEPTIDTPPELDVSFPMTTY